MPRRIATTDELYFVTITIVDWIDLFTRRIYSDVVIENLSYCQKHKHLNIYAYVLMTNHLHLIANVDEGTLSDVLRDFKTFTSKELFKIINGNERESRRDWLISSFERSGKNNPLNKRHQLWQNGNHPVLL
jgi:REP element-mobilizing transposase RayT